MNRLDIFNEALVQLKALHEKFPGLETIVSIIRQVEYLIEVERDASRDRSRLKDIIIGIQAAREIEPLDNNLAETLYRVNEEAKQM